MKSLAILTLLTIPGIGPRTVLRLLDKSVCLPSEPAELLTKLELLKESFPRLSVPTLDELEIAQNNAQHKLEQCEQLSIETIAYGSSDYPTRVRNIADPPVLLYVKGDKKALHRELAIAVVGTREPSTHGARIAQRFGEVFAEKDAVVISGLAIGCDSEAHKGCLQKGGITAAVLANGLDTVYPKQNAHLADQILRNSGALISEYPPGEKVRRGNFVARDRLQSGLSDAVVVVETGAKGGTMHTVRFCQEQGRLLAVYSHANDKGNAKSLGNELLLKDQATHRLRDDKDIEALLERLRNPREITGVDSLDRALNNKTETTQPTLPGWPTE